jgi:thymidine kinase
MTLTVIIGPMFSGKSKKLIELARREGYRKKSFVLFKPKRDNRYSEVDVVTHDGISEFSYVVETPEEILTISQNSISEVILIDEAQFFSDNLTEICEQLCQTKKVIVAGLNLDSFGQPFIGPMCGLISKADKIIQLTAVCVICGDEATRTVRKDVDTTEQIKIGSFDDYYPACRKCWNNAQLKTP